ncbi:MAG: 4-hydroxy-tetrahydrodipicolinate reductase [Deltaproteobacteria bacterium]|nr:4-hydroxy-tetrahydrodipicolinate reductase [Deltaproteobacteria bacterium]MBW2306443.1 4-hydroxy-tetrahydrodipicolinate reductase [Deltaproteobacteria bacterium]
MVKVVVAGAAGRMGGRVLHIMGAHSEIQVAGALEKKGHPAVGQDLGILIAPALSGIMVEDDLGKILPGADVVVSFAVPEASVEHLRVAAQLGKAAVIGTTGFSESQMEAARDFCRRARCVLSPNLSVGVNIMYKVLADVARALGDDYDVEIVEIHHRMKKDAPSGTADKMAQVIASALGRDLKEVGIYQRHGLIGERPARAIGIQTLRAGDIVGEHTVIFGGMGERLEIIHRAHSRDNFAQGAVRAALWVVNQPNGLYDMMDVLGLKVQG